jgi:hypothetical protein
VPHWTRYWLAESLGCSTPLGPNARNAEWMVDPEMSEDTDTLAWTRLALGGCWMVVAACGRIGFDPAGDGGASLPTLPLACADMNLGSAIGAPVASGSTANMGNDYRGCRGADDNDVTFGWIAPATGRYQFDLCASQPSWDSALSIRDGSCNGRQLACGDDECGGFGLQGLVTLDLAAGQAIVIVVDGAFGEDGNYKLAITPQ